jgi:hypothetical protein
MHVRVRVRSTVRAVLGTARTKQRTNPPASAGALAQIVLPDHDGHDIQLGELWREDPAALVWLRHYG